MAKKKFYAVAKGRVVGIYRTWPECEAQVKGVPSLFKGFSTLDEAIGFMQSNGHRCDDAQASLLGQGAQKWTVSSTPDEPQAMVGDPARAGGTQAEGCPRRPITIVDDEPPAHCESKGDWREKGAKMMQKMGWTAGQGLGRKNDGMTAPVEAGHHRGRSGLGTAGAAASAAPAESSCWQHHRTGLDAGQQTAFDAALSGQNILLTGGPGTGKSHTLRQIIAALKSKQGAESVMVTAPTGVAALITEGQTLHSSPGPGIPRGTTEAFGNMRSKTSSRIWRKCKTLVVDEISMVDAEFFDWFMSNVGAVQLVLCGDFAQLPPVPEKQGSIDSEEFLGDCVAAGRRKGLPEGRRRARECDPAINDQYNGQSCWLDPASHTPFGLKETSGKFAFQSMAWRRAALRILHLTEVHRTREPMLLDALAALRQGDTGSDAICRLITATNRPLPDCNGIVPTVLYARKRDVQRDNEAQLARLDIASRQVYRATDSVSLHEDAPPWVTEAKLLENSFFKTDCQAASEFELRTGAQVMLLKNEVETDGISQRLVNGSRGVVIAWDWALPQADDRPDSYINDHRPGKKARYDDEPGGAPSREEEAASDSEGGARIMDDAQLPREGVYDYQSEPPELPTEAPPPGALCGASGVPQLFPVVRFIGRHGAARLKLIRPESFERHLYLKGTCSRVQIPLALAWSLTIHKAQGSTLDYLSVDLQGCFEDGQACVAISRARSVDGLEIRNFTSACVRSSPLVREFYAAVDGGGHGDFLCRAGVWWGEPILNHSLTRWKSLYMRHPTFRGWVQSLSLPAPEPSPRAASAPSIAAGSLSALPSMAAAARSQEVAGGGVDAHVGSADRGGCGEEVAPAASADIGGDAEEADGECGGRPGGGPAMAARSGGGRIDTQRNGLEEGLPPTSGAGWSVGV